MFYHRKLSLGGTLLALLLIFQTTTAFYLPKTVQIRTSASAGQVSLVSGGQSGGTYAVIAAGGRFVAFESPANDLTPGVISDSWDVYLRDEQTGQIERADTRTGGGAVYNPGDYTSPPALSADGRFVAFMSQAENLVSNDGNKMPDIFLHDRASNATGLVSVTASGGSGNDASYTPAVSADGRFVVFQSFANNLVQSDTNNSMDVFIRDRQTGVTELVSVTSSGAQGSDPHDYGFPGVSLSDDGRYVAFSYQNLPVAGSPSSGPNIYLRDRQTHITRWISSGTLPRLTGDGRFLAFVTSDALTSDDQNGGPDVYLLDLTTNQFERVSVASGVPDPPGALIDDQPSLASGARYIAFETTAALVPADTNDLADIYLYDRQTKTNTLVSANPAGTPGNGESHFPSITADGTTIAFTSLASNLVPNDINGQNDVFVFHRTLPIAALTPMVYLPYIFSK